MATTRNGNGEKGKNVQAIAQSVLDTLEQGKTPKAVEPPAEAPRSEEAKLDKRFIQVSDGSCVTALEKAHGFDKAALNLECAVSIALFAFAPNGPDRATKRHAMDLYKQAGYDTDPKGEDYKTINRRVNAFASLYIHEERETWINAMEDRTEVDAIESIKNFLTQEYNFRGINDILAAAGKPVTQTNTPERRAGQPARASTTAGGEAGTAAPQGTAGEGGTTPEGAAITKEGTIDKRVAPEGDTSIATKEAKGEISKEEGDRMAGKGEAKGEPSPEDKAVAAQVGEQAQARKEGDVKFGRRKADHGIVLMAGSLQLAIPYGTTGADLQAMFTKLATLVATVNEGTVIDESFNKFGDSPRDERNQRVTH